MKALGFQIDWRRFAEAAWRIMVFVIAAAILFIVLMRWSSWQGAPGWQTTDDAYLQADLTPIAAKVPGYVTVVPVEDYERVRAGQIIARVFDGDYRAGVAQAEAGLASATAQDAVLKAQSDLQLANVDSARAVIASTTAALEQNDRDLARQQKLLETGSSSTEASEKLRTTRDQLNAQLLENRAQAEAATRHGGAAPNIPDLTKSAGLTWGIGPQISWSFPNQIAPRSRVNQAEAASEAASDEFDSTVLRALKETEQALSTYGAELSHHQALLVVQDRARRAFDMARDQRQAGAIADIDLLAAEQSVVAADTAVAVSDAALVQEQISLFKTLGGGWMTANDTG